MKLLSELELKQKLAELYRDSHTRTESGFVANDWPDVFANKIMPLIKSQQQAWGEYVIGEDDNGDIDTVVSDSVRNNLRDEQRKRNTGKVK